MAFGAYFAMYAFRKPFTVASFAEAAMFGGEAAMTATPKLAALTALALALHLLPGDWTEQLEQALRRVPAPAYGLAFGLVLFRERLSALQVMGVCVAVTGLTLVSMSSGLV